MTDIEWVLNPDGTRGITVNSKTGCLNHTPEGLCLGGLFPCYAFKLANGRLKLRYLVNHNVANWESNSDTEKFRSYNDPFYPRFWPERLDKIRGLKKPTGIFLDDMSDWMGDYWPEEWTRQELQVMKDCPQHRFYTLTKQPQNLIKFSPFPENCWVGVTITQNNTDAGSYLSKIEAKVKFVSFEPLLRWAHYPQEILIEVFDIMGISWLIIGACTGSASGIGKVQRRYPDLAHKPLGNKWTAQPPISWLREIVEAADKAGVKVFLKDNLEPLLRTADGQIPSGLCDNYGHTLRQELP